MDRKFGIVAMSSGRPLLGIFDEDRVIREFIEISDPQGHYEDFGANETEIVEVEGNLDSENVEEGFSLVSLAQHDYARDEEGNIPINFLESVFHDVLDNEVQLRILFNTIWNETVAEVLKYGEVLETPIN